MCACVCVCVCVRMLYVCMHVHLCEYMYVGLCKRACGVSMCRMCVHMVYCWEEGIKCERDHIQIRSVSSHTVVHCELPAHSLCCMLL